MASISGEIDGSIYITKEGYFTMKKKLLAALLAGMMALSLTACGDTNTEPSSDGEGETTETYTVGICQLMEHAALDAATQGFQDALKEELGEDAVTFEYQNAQGDSNTCSTIINGFVSNGVDLILANATPALQAAAAGTSEIPILGTAVTEYGVALTASPARTSPAPPTWLPWTSRPRCSRSGSPMLKTWACCIAPLSPTPSIRLMW